MRWFALFVTVGLISTATQVEGQEPVGVIIRNPYYQADVRPVPSPTVEARPVSAPLSFPFSAPLEAKAKLPLRVVSSSQMMQALRDAVQAEPTKLESKQGVASLAPARFVPAADAAPIAALQTHAPSNSHAHFDRAIVTASALTTASPTIADRDPIPVPAAPRGLLRDAVDAHLEVTRLSSNPSSNPLRDSAPETAPVAVRVANPLR